MTAKREQVWIVEGNYARTGWKPYELASSEGDAHFRANLHTQGLHPVWKFRVVAYVRAEIYAPVQYTRRYPDDRPPQTGRA
jgi:hypothetical protein